MKGEYEKVKTKVRKHLTIPEVLAEALTKEAETSGQTESALITSALIDFLSERKNQHNEIQKKLKELNE